MKAFKEIAMPAIILCLICGLLTAALAGTNALTKDVIQKQSEQAEQDALNAVMPADSFEVIKEENKMRAFKAVKDGEVCGYAFSVSAAGYGGDVSAIIGIKDGKITAVEITDVSGETPGLGQNVKKPDFTDRFKGQTSTENVDAITGATITSNAVKSAVETALKTYEEVAADE